MEAITIGLDLAKNVFAVHGVDKEGRVVLRAELRRSQVLKYFARLKPCVIGMEASNGAHYWGRELRKLGHEPKLMPASYVKSYVKRNKTDAIDAEANCEAVSRPTMRFVPVKSVEQQGLLTLHRSRDLMIAQRTQTSNALRSFCAEFGVVAAKGRMPLEALFALVENEADDRLPATARLALVLLVAQHRLVSRNIAALDREIGLVQKCDAQRRLMTIPGIGILTASALLATIGEVDRFERGRDLAAWIGLTPRAHSSGGKKKLLCITKMGDGYLRKLLVQGAMSLIRCAQTSKTPIGAWLRQMLARKPRKLAALALANKLARIAWAILAKGGTYGHPLAAQA